MHAGRGGAAAPRPGTTWPTIEMVHETASASTHAAAGGPAHPPPVAHQLACAFGRAPPARARRRWQLRPTGTSAPVTRTSRAPRFECAPTCGALKHAYFGDRLQPRLQRGLLLGKRVGGHACTQQGRRAPTSPQHVGYARDPLQTRLWEGDKGVKVRAGEGV